MNQMEARLNCKDVFERTEKAARRYDFRKLEARDMNTQAARYAPGFESAYC